MDHARYLDIALEEAELARREGAMPVGSVIVAPDGSVLSRGHNRVLTRGDQTAHAEVEAIRTAGAIIATPPAEGAWILYTSSEPCAMCLGAILFTSINTVVWAADSAMGGAYDAVVASKYWHERVKKLQVTREPSPGHRSRSRDLLREFYLRQGNLAFANWLSGP